MRVCCQKWLLRGNNPMLKSRVKVLYRKAHRLHCNDFRSVRQWRFFQDFYLSAYFELFVTDVCSSWTWLALCELDLHCVTGSSWCLVRRFCTCGDGRGRGRCLFGRFSLWAACDFGGRTCGARILRISEAMVLRYCPTFAGMPLFRIRALCWHQFWSKIHFCHPLPRPTKQS